ncbi:ABC transporter permease [Candidatus Woesearchaeota archaeon]|nr:ABC transporter permease [Candidatus Woesearchaeota archaeon]MCF7901311.1 ABC transporter permease [Candidatus Woesearchaeota archaeon]MCF8013783.1 ABC transporter permease [Candidatus Woesearchaeota archaeon]
MKLWNAIKKNFQLLFRSKASATMVLLGPLLVVVIIGLSFLDSGVSAINVGFHSPDNSELTLRYIENLNTTENNLINYNSSEKCISSVKQGVSLVCILFPEDFVLSDDKTNEVKFYVDESRINLVHQIIAKFSFNLDTESTEVQKELTSKMLAIMSKASTDVKSSVATIIGVKAKSGTISSSASTSQNELSNLDTSQVEIDLGSILSSAKSLKSDFNTLESDSDNVVDEGYDMLEDANNVSGTFRLALSDLNSTLISINSSSVEFDNLISDISVADEGVNNLKSKVSATANAKSAVLSNLNQLSSTLSKVQTDLDSIKVTQEGLDAELKGFKFKEADSIVSPVETTIEPISTNSSKVTFSFPYLLMLIVMFVGLMLSSTLVYMEKNSRAFFRSFTLPVDDLFFIFSTYFTTMITLLIQIFVVLVVVYFGLGVNLFNNILPLVILLILGMSLFTFLGMAVGNLFNSSEGMMMSTIFLSSIFLFLSNLVLPLETLSPFIQKITSYNPYVIASESIRKAVLFNFGFETLWKDMLMLFIYAIIVFGITYAVKKAANSKYLLSLHNKFRTNVEAPEDKYLHINDVNLTIRNIFDLLNCLRTLSDVEYETITKKENIFADWLRNTMKKKILATRIRHRKRVKAIKILEKYLRNKS